VPGYADLLQGDDRMILSVKPGITGLASLKYRNEEAVLAQQPDPQYYNDAVIWPDKVRINCWYVQNRSWQLDLLILFYTLLPFSIDVDEFITKRNKR
jgi:lipopolysaccharide/colanic/teichoic acid biosynthesis glycosyltransferase